MADIEYKITVDADGAIRSISQLEQAETNLDKTQKTLQNSADGLGLKYTELNSILGLAERGFNLISSAANTAIDALKRGSDVNDITAAFSDLSAKAGVAADVLLKDLNTATLGTISNFDLMRQANAALNAGIKPDLYTELAKAAKALSDVTGQDTKQSLDELTSSLIKGSDRAFKAIGINVDLAESFGDLSKAMTEQQRVEATRLLIQQQLITKNEQLASSQADTADIIEAAFKGVNDEIDDLKSTLASAQFITDFIELIGESARRVTKSVTDLIEFFVQGIDRIYKATVSTGRAIGDFLDKTFGGQDTPVGQADPRVQQIQEQDKKLKELTQTLEGQAKATDEVTKAQREQIKAAQELESLVKKASSLSGIQGYISQLVDLRKAVDEGVISQDVFRDKVGEVKGELDRASVSIDQQVRIFDKASDIRKEFDNKLQNGRSSQADQFFADLLGIEDPSFKEGLALSLADGFLGALTLATDLIANNPTTTEVSQGIGSVLGTAIGAFFDGPQGAAVGSQLGGAIFGTVTEFIRVFSRDSEATRQRKELDAYFADLFSADRLSVIIGGELKQITDLVFATSGSFGDTQHFSLFAGLEETARASFLGVAQAFTELVQGSQEQAGNLAATFVNNIGGSLNNLQLLVQASGISFEQLGDAIEQAFLDGSLSALEAQSALQQIQQISEVGIPGAIGAIVEAFNNLKSAGPQGGRATLDAIQDLAAEAEDLSITTIPELIEALVKSGAAGAEEIAQVFDALGAVGVDTLEELKNISTATAIAVAAQLQASGTFFDEVQQNIADTIEQIEQIPDQINKRINFVVDVEYTDRASTTTAQSALSTAGVRLPEGVS